VDSDDIMILGEICYCVPEGRGYSAGLMVEHILTGLGELESLNRGLFGGSEVEGDTFLADLSQPPAPSRR
jgi:hypothetical protein